MEQGIKSRKLWKGRLVATINDCICSNHAKNFDAALSDLCDIKYFF